MAMATLRNDYPDVLHTGLEARLAIRRNEHAGPTSGLAPGFVGLYQIDARVPSGVTPGNEVPVVVSIAGETSPPVTIAVR